MKKILRILLWTLLALTLLMAAGAWVKFGSLVRGAMSVQKLDEGLYYMEYKGDDGFAGLIGSGGGKSSGELVGYVMNFLSKGFYNPPITPAPAH